MVLPQDFDQPGLVLGEEREVFEEIEQPRRLAGAAQHHFERHAARLVLALDPLPLEEPLPVGGERTHAAFRAVGGDQQRVEPEELRECRLL